METNRQNMEHFEIDGPGHRFYTAFRELYAASFPLFEQRTEEQQLRAFAGNRYRLVGYGTDGAFVGFLSYWEFEDYRYIEHFAISPARRGQGYGGGILRDFVRSSAKIVLLEIDPVVDAVSGARLRFYRGCGFYENPYPHRHPPYREGYGAHPLVVLTTQRELTGGEYAAFCRDLAGVVMAAGRPAGVVPAPETE